MKYTTKTKTEMARHLILSALEDGLERIRQNPTGLSDGDLATEISGFVKQANQIASRFGFEPYFKP